MSDKAKFQIRRLKLYLLGFFILVPALGGIVAFVVGGSVCLLFYRLSILNNVQFTLGVIMFSAGGALMTLPVLVSRARAVILLIREIRGKGAIN